MVRYSVLHISRDLTNHTSDFSQINKSPNAQNFIVYTVKNNDAVHLDIKSPQNDQQYSVIPFL